MRQTVRPRLLLALFLLSCAGTPGGFKRGRDLAAHGEYAAAVEEYKRALAESPDSAEVLAALGEALLELGRYDDAAEALERAQQLAATDAGVMTLAAARVGQGRYEDAAKLVSEVLSRNPAPANQVRLGLIRLAQRRADEAIELLQAALSASPNDLEAMGALGRAQEMKGLHAEAATTLERVVKEFKKVGPTSATFYVALGAAYEGQNRTEDAARAFRIAAQHDPRNVDAVAAQGGFLRRQGKIEQAIEHLKSAEMRNPTAARVKLELGLAYRDFHSEPQALASLEKAVELDASLAAAYPPLVELLRPHGKDSDKLYAALQGAAGVLQDDFKIQLELGKAASSRKQWEVALDALELAVKAQPNDIEANYLLGVAQAKAGEFEDARASWKALEVLDAVKAEALGKAIDEAEAKALAEAAKKAKDDKDDKGDDGKKKKKRKKKR